MSVVHVHNVEEYKNLTATPGKLVVVDFSATWCGPCKKIAPVYSELAAKHTGALFLHVDVDEVNSLDEVQAIKGVPTFHFIKDGQKLAEVVGANTANLTANVEKHI